MPVRESHKSKDGHSYTLWIDIHDALKATVPIHARGDRAARRQRNMMFRGHADADWDLVPTLFRAPVSKQIIDQRQKYTDQFMNALVKNSHELKLENLSDRKLLAIAQHYGFYTHLLDFTRNLEVAAYFGTYTEQPPRIGVVFAFPIDEYNSLRNPFAALGASLDMAEEALGDLALPPILDEDFDDVPRIYEQEGVFIECPVDKTKTIQDNCIDRYYFYQKPGVIHKGKFAFETSLMSSRWFATKEAYASYREIAQREHPEVFQQTTPFDTADLFPPIDPVSIF